MAEDTSRAVGAGSNATIMIGDKECQIRPLTIAELGELERECLSRYKRSYLQTFSENADLVEGGTELVSKKLEEVAKWDVSDLPTKTVYDPGKVKVNKRLHEWLKENTEIIDEDEKRQKLSKTALKIRIQVMTALSLDNGELTDATYESLVGIAPKKMRTGFVQWWITATCDGMISMVYICFKGNDLTREEIVRAIGDNPSLLSDASRQIERLSAPEAGNG